jgi:hypothetical protein
MADPPSSFVAREKAAYVATADKIFIFGGLDGSGKALGDGALYNPTTDSWTVLPASTNAPTSRQLATALWTNDVIFVVGGADQTGGIALKSGSKYNPLTDAWTALSPLPTGRVAPYMANAPNNEYVMTWGGASVNGTPLSGGEFCAHSGTTWTALATGIYGSGATVPALSELTWGAGDNFVFVFGGQNGGTTKSAASYEYVSVYNTAPLPWLSLIAGPSARWGALGVWDGTSFYVWGGRNETQAMSDGSLYAPTPTAWTSLSTTTTPPSARWAPHRRSGWMFALGTGDVIVLGGVDYSGTLQTDGGRYNKSTTEWTKVPSWPSGETHEYGVAATVGGKVFVWGGRNGTSVTATGERFSP